MCWRNKRILLGVRVVVSQVLTINRPLSSTSGLRLDRDLVFDTSSPSNFRLRNHWTAVIDIASAMALSYCSIVSYLGSGTEYENFNLYLLAYLGSYLPFWTVTIAKFSKKIVVHLLTLSSTMVSTGSQAVIICFWKDFSVEKCISTSEEQGTMDAA
ncbi:hypothetical protein FN846DRAFT_663516 [Sphaerosporella brunnea]|uniref:Uncharacterized protein n=1 Tax=Sphaerosporella brunnea TaxID=1250544 RepID=A0A5J5EZI5_9PEZI|nr:hypothetical protein FN846DRAFT_663516 [Sphaerosporella brunnea]